MSLKQAFRSETEAESSKTVVIPVMTTVQTTWKEEMAATKAMLERLVKKSEEKEARIKLQEEKIARLTRKLEKQPAQSLAKIQKVRRRERLPKVKLLTRRST